MSGSSTSSWRRLARWALWFVLAVAVVAVLFEVVFPWFEVTYYNPTLG